MVSLTVPLELTLTSVSSTHSTFAEHWSSWNSLSYLVGRVFGLGRFICVNVFDIWRPD